MPITKSDVAKHLDMSERNLTEVLRGLNIDYRIESLCDIRIAYIRDLREKAAGRGGDHQIESALALTRKNNAQADLYEIQKMERCGQLLLAEKVEPFIKSAVVAARQLLLSLPRKWSQEIKAINEIDVDEQYFENDITDALNQLSGLDITNASQNEPEDNAGMEATEQD